MTALRSPNEIFEASKEQMLDGRDPATREDWMLLANFWAYNLAPEVVEPAMALMVMLYDAPLDPRALSEIIEFQRGALATEGVASLDAIGGTES